MKTALFSLVLSSVAIYTSHACSCIYISDFFCPSVSWVNGNGGSDDLYIGLAKVESIYGYYMDVKVVDNLQNTLPDTTITILGQDGLNCNEWIGHFEVDKTFIIAIRKSGWEEGVYDLSGCGRFWLPVIDDKVQGNITEELNEQSYTDFKQEIAQCAGITGAGEHTLPSLRLYPNPTTGQLFIEGLNPEGELHYRIFSSAGRLVKAGQISRGHSPSLSLSGLPGGVYHLRLQAGKAVMSRRIVLSLTD